MGQRSDNVERTEINAIGLRLESVESCEKV
jgi:hypothetical protein